MGLFMVRPRKEESRKPTEKIAITNDVEIAIWVKQNAEGERKVYFNLSRLTPEGQSYRTLRSSNCRSVVKAIAKLSKVFSNDPALPQDQRDELSRLSELLEEVEGRLTAAVPGGGAPAANGHATSFFGS
jgi:hypothetical protein